MVKALLTVSTVIFFTSACTGYSTYSGEQKPLFYTSPIESTVNVDLPADVVQKNVSENAQRCWFSVFSGKIETIAHDPASGYGRVAFVIPGRIVGSKVTLASIDIYSASQTESTLVSRVHSTGGNWEDFEPANWAQGTKSTC